MDKASYNRFSYSIRPRKSIQRRIMLDLLRSAQTYVDLREFVYIGFGSVYFVDFLLFNRHFHFKQLVSIEGQVGDKKRFEFSKPLGSIDIKYGLSSDVLPKLDRTQPIVAWLDYDEKLDSNKLDDLEWFVQFAKVGSIFFITVDADLGKTAEVLKEAVESQVSLIGERIVYMRKESQDWHRPTPHLSCLEKVCEGVINAQLGKRNLSLDPAERLSLTPIFSAHYADGNRMFTLGWQITNKNLAKVVKSNLKNSIGFPKVNGKILDITYPLLTRPEQRFVEKHVASSRFKTLMDRHCIPIVDAKEYARLYRYCPQYAEMEW